VSQSEAKDLTSYTGRTLSALVVLAVVEQDKSHSGYSLIKRIKVMTSNSIIYRAGALYPLIEKLCNQGLLIKSIENTKTKSDLIRQKAIYSISKKGIIELEMMRNEWNEFKTHIEGLVDDK